ncbi:MAG: HAMP domain-containing protein [Betaproteobacteria bacterium]|nr:HAMP domain-containing protein [Betaproteobacteria bacterium]MDE2623048.1 HAMP domain-containing protein [Betaproteobacteria bacterium]
MKWAITLAVLAGGALLYMLSEATANTSLFSAHYPRLLALGAGVALGLMALISFQLWTLYGKLRDRVFGSKLTLKLIVIFALMAVLPGSLVYGVSVKFLSNSIESWFDVNVDKALSAGLNLGQTTFDSLLNDLAQKGEAMSAELSDASALDETTLLYHLREQFGVQEATLFSKSGSVLAFSSALNNALIPEALPISSSITHQIRSLRAYKMVETLPGKGLYLRVVVPVNRLSFSEDLRALQLMQPVSRELAADADSVEAAYRGYQELLLARTGLKRIYGLNLTLALLLTLLTAIALAFVISERLGAPLSALAESTRAIGAGDYTKMTPVVSDDELGVLTRSFNTMTAQLREASAARLRDQEKLTAAKAYQESILSNLSTGVIVFDASFHLKSANLSANQMLGVDRVQGECLEDWGGRVPELLPIAQHLAQQFHQAAGAAWEGDADYLSSQGKRKFHFRGNRLPEEHGGDYVLVFDDITQMVQAQRDAAWGEVARRLAHEIKNPLTPIQLAAERLKFKLSEKLPQAEADILERSTATIVNQVDALKNMVNDFSEYARSSKLTTRSLDLNRLIREVLVLYESMGEKIEVRLEDPLPLIDGDATRLRQVIHNLVQNALDALQGLPDPRVVVSTARASDAIRLSVADNGQGFSEDLLGRIFEPYVTTKSKGTGLGLPIVKKIVEEHHGKISVSNLELGGAEVSILFPLPEIV